MTRIDGIEIHHLTHVVVDSTGRTWTRSSNRIRATVPRVYEVALEVQDKHQRTFVLSWHKSEEAAAAAMRRVEREGYFIYPRTLEVTAHLYSSAEAKAARAKEKEDGTKGVRVYAPGN